MDKAYFAVRCSSYGNQVYVGTHLTIAWLIWDIADAGQCEVPTVFGKPWPGERRYGRRDSIAKPRLLSRGFAELPLSRNFDWGTASPGSSQLAFAIALDVFGSDYPDLLETQHIAFADKVIAAKTADSWVLRADEASFLLSVDLC